MKEHGRSMLKGVSVSSGVSMGEVHVITQSQLPAPLREFTSAEEEIQRLGQGIDLFCYHTYQMFQQMRNLLGQEDALILGGQIFMARDLEFVEELHQEIRKGNTAEASLHQVFSTYLAHFDQMEDVVMAQRGADLVDMRDSILGILGGHQGEHSLREKQGVVICAKGIGPSLMAIVAQEQVAAILCEEGGSTSHCAILARSAGIPAIFGVEHLLDQVREGDLLVVDGIEGQIICNPTPEMVQRYQEKARWFEGCRADLEQYRSIETQNARGDRIELMTNVIDLSQVHRGMELGVDGVGLFRTEFLYMETDTLPSEELQLNTYRRAAAMTEGKPVVIRTLDIGGDKKAPCLPQDSEENPFLGLRGVRYCLKHSDLFKTQIRAILRAGAQQGNLSILIPFVTQIEEIHQVKALIKECRAQLKAEGLPFADHLPFGVVVETPSAAILMDYLVEMVDFISVGTNDLVQYIAAADRGNPKMEDYYNPFQLSVLRILKHIISKCQRKNIPVTICGELVTDPRMIPVLLSFGQPGFSVAPSGVLAVRRELASWTQERAKEAVLPVMTMASSQEIQQYLEQLIRTRDASREEPAFDRPLCQAK